MPAGGWTVGKRVADIVVLDPKGLTATVDRVTVSRLARVMHDRATGHISCRAGTEDRHGDIRRVLSTARAAGGLALAYGVS